MARSFWCCFLLVSFFFASLAAQDVLSADVAEDVMQDYLIHKVDPVPPADAVHVQGTVILKAIIDTKGSVINLRVVSGHPLLLPAAIEAVRFWKFRPYYIGGSAVNVTTTIHLNFGQPEKQATQATTPDSTADATAPWSGLNIGTPPPAPTPSAATPQSERVRIPSDQAVTLLKQWKPPVYPPSAHDQGIEGKVALLVTIDKKGNVSAVKMINGDDDLLVPAAINAVKKWKYKPYLVNQVPTEFETVVEVSFALPDCCRVIE